VKAFQEAVILFRSNSSTCTEYSRASRFAFAAALGLAVVALIFLLSRGTTGGDEATGATFAKLWWQGGWSAVTSRMEMDWVAHRFFWCLQKTLWNGLLIGLPWVAKNFTLHDAFLALDGVVFMLATSAVGIWHLRKRDYDWSVALLATAGILLASSAVSFFGGGILECQMCFYAMVLMAALDRPGAVTRRRMAVILPCTSLLIFCKAYSVLFLLPLALLMTGRLRLVYLGWIAAMPVLWGMVLQIVGDGASGGMLAFYLNNLTNGASLTAMGFRFVELVFSPAYGLVWCFPLLLMAALVPAQGRRNLLIKVSGLFLVSMALCIFDFWHGYGASAGPRYIVPFLLLFLPEVACGFKALLSRWRWAGLLVPVLTLLFLPSIEYRNSLMYRWAEDPVAPGRCGAVACERPGIVGWGYGDPLLHPGIFGWRVVMARIEGAEDFRPSFQVPLYLHTRAIFPMTGVSRVVYALERRGLASDPSSRKITDALAKAKLDSLMLWMLIRALIVAAVLVSLLIAAWRSAKTVGLENSLIYKWL
jgi:hypothetical protein